MSFNKKNKTDPSKSFTFFHHRTGLLFLNVYQQKYNLLISNEDVPSILYSIKGLINTIALIKP